MSLALLDTMPKVPNRAEKICLLIDINRLSSATGGRRVNFRRLREHLVGHREAVVVKVYCGEVRDERNSFYDQLRKLGFEVIVSKNPRSHSRAANDDDEICGGISCEIAYDMCNLISSGYYDSIVLVTGAFELANTVSRVRSRGVEVEVAFFPDLCSPTLRGRATRFRPLDMEILEFEDRREKAFT